ncbi:MAG: TetR/AcrR family transcriptional regulator [Chloroflexi bacterium]|nr:TetR/AcrR family transcriptional regulator [Chloroflexota bacterium]
MPSGAQTRARAVRQAAPWLNCHGYLTSSVADILAATGLQKGGLYNHFPSKEALALEAFDYAFDQSSRRISHAVEQHQDAGERLLAFIGAFRSFLADPPIRGGCPVLNAAIEADHGHVGLRARARLAMDAWRGLLARTVRAGVERGELVPDADPETVASVLISTLEGAVMLGTLYGEPAHMQRATAHLEHYVERELRRRSAD